MKHHHGNLLARPSLRTMASHYVHEGKTSCYRVFIEPKSRNKKNRRRRKKEKRGGLEIMLTTLFLVAYLIHAAFVLPINRIKFLSRYSISAGCGILVALTLVLGLAKWPQPSVSLDLNGLVSPPNQADLLAWAQDDGTIDEGCQIPPELYPNYIDPMAQDPMVVASVALPGETWREPREDETSQPNVEIASSQENQDKSQTDQEKKIVHVPLTKGIYHQIRVGDNLWDLARAYGVSHNKLVMYNQNIDPTRLMPGQKVFIPGANSPLPKVPAKQNMILPIKGRGVYVISGYGLRKHPIGGDIRFHRGVDLQPVYVGKPVYAVLNGVVTYAGPLGGKGLVVQIKHDNGLETIYAHNSRLLVKRGMHVKQGQQISKAGSTGYSTGPHLHFEVWKNGKHVNPLLYLPKLKSQISRYYASSRKRSR